MVRLEDLVKVRGRLPRHYALSDRQLELVQKWLDEDWEARDHDRDIITLIKRLLATAKTPIGMP